MEISRLDGLWKCNKCGACTAVCPLYQRTVQEGMVARGKLALLEAVVEKRLRPTRIVRERLEDCLLCGACAQNCPSLVPTTALFLEARAGLARDLGIPLPIRLFLGALGSPGLLDLGMSGLRLFQQSGIPRVVEGRLRSWVPEAVRAAVRTAPPVPPRPYRSRALPPEIGNNGGRGTVAYFAGCFMNWSYADAAEATRAVLVQSGYQVESPPVVCCGIPHRAYGDAEGARRLARTNVRALERYEAVVTDCASCGAGLKEYRELLADDPAYRDRGAAVAARVFDVAEFLVKQGFPRAQVEVRMRVTYHEPCHLGRGQGVKAQPRELLKSIPGIELVEMREADACCGGAGSFCVTHPGLAKEVGGVKVRNILATQADAVASGCPACLSQLRAMLRAEGAATRVVHPMALLAESYRKSRQAK